ncbi:MAG: helix-turn-helix transcriptional regulator [Brumimicrobium sp.]|nr:helix-turn-helix transcriptional regulator [Brumimicrobium sp.]
MDVAKNIKQIRLAKSINQDVIADALGVDPAVISNIENGKREIKVSELEIISKCLNINVIDLITYPKVYVDKNSIDSSERISVTFEVSPDKRDYLLKMVTGDQNLQNI